MSAPRQAQPQPQPHLTAAHAAAMPRAGVGAVAGAAAATLHAAAPRPPPAAAAAAAATAPLPFHDDLPKFDFEHVITDALAKTSDAMDRIRRIGLTEPIVRQRSLSEHNGDGDGDDVGDDNLNRRSPLARAPISTVGFGEGRLRGGREGRSGSGDNDDVVLTIERPGDCFAANVIALAAAVAGGGIGGPSSQRLRVVAVIDGPPLVSRRQRPLAASLPLRTPLASITSPAAAATEAAAVNVAPPVVETPVGLLVAAKAAVAATSARPSALTGSSEMTLFAQRLHDIEALTESLEGEFAQSFFELEHASAARVRRAEAAEAKKTAEDGVEGMLAELEAAVDGVRGEMSTQAQQAVVRQPRRGRRRTKPRPRKSRKAAAAAAVAAAGGKSPLQRRPTNVPTNV